MKLTASTAATYAAMLGKLLPRGPIWDGAQAALGALLTALGAELNEVHARLVQVMEEAFPNTADETLADWLRVWGLPGPCSTMPATDDGKRELLAGKVAAQGGQSRAYYIGVARAVLGDLAADVTIEENPDGVPFRVSISRVGDRLVGSSSAHTWVVHLPAATTATQEDAIDCLVQAYKPAHTVVTVERDGVAYYSSPGGAGDYLEASTALAARVFFPETGPAAASWSFGFWIERDPGTADDARLFSVASDDSAFFAPVFDPGFGDSLDTVLVGSTGSLTQNVAPTPDTSAWTRISYTYDVLLDELRTYVDGVEQADNAEVYEWNADNVLFRILSHATGGQELDGRIRNVLINDRWHTGDEEAALAAAGPTHNPLKATGAWAAGQSIPVIWNTPAVGGSVANSGDGGICNLVLNGAVTSETDP